MTAVARRICSSLAPLLAAATAVSAQDGASALRFEPAAPRGGQTITVTYDANTRLAARESLVLRGHYRSARGESHNTPPSSAGTHTVAVTMLRRTTANVFVGSFALPDSVVYGTFAVEDSTGSVVDDNHEQLWELLRFAADGRPAVEALEQRINDLIGRNWEEALAAARAMTELYPERVRAWTYLQHFELLLLGDARADSLRAVHRNRIAELERRFQSDDTMRADDIAYMAFFVNITGLDSATVARWLERAQLAAPMHALTLFRRGDAAVLEYGGDYRQLIGAFDALWRDAGESLYATFHGTSLQRAMSGLNFHMARTIGDSAATMRWAERYAARGRYTRRAAAQQLVLLPAFRTVGMRWLRDELRTLAALPPAHRYLGETVTEQQQRHRREMRPLFAALGKALIADGQHRAGLDTMTLADDGGWDVTLFRVGGDARLTAGDTAGALALYARVIADPRTAPALADSIAPLARRTLGADVWLDQLERARAELPRRLLAGMSRAPLKASVTLTDTAGVTHDLAQLGAGGISLIIYWSRFCGPAVAELPAAQAIAQRLAQSGVRIISITSEKPSAELNAWLREKRIELPVYSDPTNALRPAINARATPAYWLLDATSNVRFTFDKANGQRALDELIVQVAALQAEAGRHDD